MNGFGTTAIINDETFKGGQGSNNDDYNGLSIYVLNSAEVQKSSVMVNLGSMVVSGSKVPR